MSEKTSRLRRPPCREPRSVAASIHAPTAPASRSQGSSRSAATVILTDAGWNDLGVLQAKMGRVRSGVPPISEPDFGIVRAPHLD